MLQLFYIFYVFPFFGLRLSTFTAGVLGLAINYGAYLSEVFRAGIEAVEGGVKEAIICTGFRNEPITKALKHDECTVISR